MPWLPQCIELLRAGVIPRQIHESENKKAADCEQVEKYSVTFLVYFLTMASQTGCEIMNTEVAGSILTAFLVYQVKEKKGLSHVQEPAKLNPLKNDKSNTNHCKSL